MAGANAQGVGGKYRWAIHHVRLLSFVSARYCPGMPPVSKQDSYARQHCFSRDREIGQRRMDDKESDSQEQASTTQPFSSLASLLTWLTYLSRCAPNSVIVQARQQDVCPRNAVNKCKHYGVSALRNDRRRELDETLGKLKVRAQRKVIHP